MSVARKEKRKKRPLVVSRHGTHRFQTGMVTAWLLNRGLTMDEATEIARLVRDDIAHRQEITSEKLVVRICATVAEHLGSEVADRLRAAERNDDAVPLVQTAHGRFPFSKGVVLRDLDTSGMELEAAMELVRELERWAYYQSEPVLPEARLHDALTDMLALRHGPDLVRRYRLTSWVRRAETPVIILLGGATGTGKSTLAMELAYRLGVAWVTSTDMIRETMRTVLTPDLVPGLHDHSFRGIMLGGQVLSDPRERVLAGFRQQAGQVAVGVRAVIQRAIRENAHIIIEGTHIAPPFEQYLPSDAEVNMAGFILAVPDEAEHRKRFPQREKRQARRPAETYLDAFQSVRWIHDDLLRMAEESEAVIVANVKRSRTLLGAVDFLSRALPVDVPAPSRREPPALIPARFGVPTLFLILDGLGDEPNPALGNRTPLAAATTPTLRRLAALGGQGQVATSSDPEVPSTSGGIMALLGPPDQPKVGRGAFEALGQGIPIPTDAVMFRGNLATVNTDGSIVDRRAGRIRAGVNDLLSELREVPLSAGIVGRIYPAHEHRVVVVLSGPGLSSAVTDTDPGDGASVLRVADPVPLDDTPEAGRTADALRELLAIVRERLGRHPLNAARTASGAPAANAILTRGASPAPPRRNEDDWRGAIVSGCNTALGVGRFLGLKGASSVLMTGNLDTDLDAKFRTAGELLNEMDFVAVHIKGADVAAHDCRPLEKRDFLSSVDAALGLFLEQRPDLSGSLRVVVSADHSTSSISGRHQPGPVPLLLATWRTESEEESDFTEESAASGALGLLRRGELMQLLSAEPESVPHTLSPPP